MRPINKDEAEILLEGHLRQKGWSVMDSAVTRKRWRDHLEGKEAHRVFLHDGKIVAVLEGKKPDKDLWTTLDQEIRLLIRTEDQLMEPLLAELLGCVPVTLRTHSDGRDYWCAKKELWTKLR